MCSTDVTGSLATVPGVDWLEAITERVRPAAQAPELAAPALVAALVVAAVAVTWRPAWAALRLAVTLVHELGHAAVGVAVGRRFTGFVLRSDMSGHAVTVGRPRGPGMIAMTWAGYPAPALLGSALVWLGAHGWSAPTLAVGLLALLAALPFVRSGLTAAVVLGTGAAVGCLWWAGTAVLQQQALVAIGVVLLVGAWRHLGAVAARPTPASDPGTLARLTRVPTGLWVLSMALVCGLATWAAVAELVPVVRA